MEKLPIQPYIPSSFQILDEAQLPYTIVSEVPFKVEVPMGVKDITDSRQILTRFTDALEIELGARRSSILESPKNKMYYIHICNS